MNNKTLKFPLNADLANHLVDIRSCKVPIVDILSEIKNGVNKFERLQELLHFALMQRTNDVNDIHFDTWLSNWLRRFYNIEEIQKN